ncbi:sulfur carrier protein ThiS [Kribbella solani]|uniref:Sulfur carrier protein n=1 Tax=Kribbella solani TaxID=236067 RepID=A0A841DYC2_9ACTN|nr:sulfur carrier protein ThiS [Kribbella solani]MBB5981197.1 sulfur carrier protein [Kribbella solani]MDX2968725.1 sulfur carrier protein ThiS [Kribbella solani]MDX3005945.1 sulfur carrier protein ThiS [Kribbella solani]
MESVWVNGAAVDVPAGQSVAELIAEYSDRSTGIAVAVNQTVLTKAEWAATAVRAGDRVEIVSATQGG